MNKQSLHFKALVLLLLAFPVFLTFGQTDFNNYKTLISKGEIPADFSSASYEKIDEDLANERTDLKGKKEKLFLKGIHYSIDQMLHSGIVVYGDEVSTYISDVAKHLLKDDPTLFSELRFYTIKSNVSNAFSTDQGIIFMTSGLISQLTSEAQLAFVLAHEISHYTKKHVVEGFDWNMRNTRISNRIEKLSQYSKEKEFDADRFGLDLYHAAGYSKKEVLPTLDVLMYSYLPFDEVEVPISYWNSKNMFIPAEFFPTEKFPIKAVEDEDDSKSSHPNIQKRKSAMEAALNNFGVWGTEKNALSIERFNEIRKICRFESLRTDIIDAHFADALYSIFILEKETDNSIYLARMKAKAWLGIAQFRQEGSLNGYIPKQADYEGEIATMYYFLKKLDKLEMAVVGLRQIEDIRAKYPEDKEINLIWKRMIQTAARSDKFKLDEFSTMTFEEAEAKFELSKQDTLVKTEVVEDKKLSKYEKIKKKSNTNDPLNFDAKNFYLYGVSDLIANEDFLAEYRNVKAKMDEEAKEKEAYDKLSYKQQRKVRKKEEKDEMHLGIQEVIFVEPLVYRYTKKGVNLIKSEKLAENFTDAIEKSATNLGISAHILSSTTLKNFGTASFNERSILLSYLNQLAEKSDVAIFPVDYEILKDIQLNYGTPNVVFSIVEHTFNMKLGGLGWAYSIMFPPVGIIAIPTAVIKGNETEMNILVMDLEQGKIVAGQKYEYSEVLSKLSMQARVYDVLSQLKKTAH